MVMLISGSVAMPSAESSAFSTSSRTVVYKLFPACTGYSRASTQYGALG